jgi:CHAT domain-containing protein
MIPISLFITKIQNLKWGCMTSWRVLYRVPFALLRDKKTQKYHFQVHPIAIAPSLRLLQHCERRLLELESSALKPEKCILAVGNATYVKNPLRGTKQELKHLQSCFPGRVRHSCQFSGAAGERDYSFHRGACLHLGVHGNWSEAKPTLKLGPQKTPNSNRTGSPKDIVKSGHQWRTRLVVLSTCNSSRGQVNQQLNHNLVVQ